MIARTAILSTLVCLGWAPMECVYAYTLGGTNTDLQGWEEKTLTFKVNSSQCTITEDELNSAIDAAIDLWNSVPTTGLKLARGGTSTATPAEAISGTSTDNPVIVCDPAFSTTTGSTADSVAGVGGFASVNDEIVYGYILLNAESGGAAQLGGLSEMERKVILAHEMGHVLGLGHSSSTSALMYYAPAAKETLSLSDDDMNGITHLYARNELGSDSAFGCGTLAAASQSGRGGLGSGGAIEITALLAACWIITRLWPRPMPCAV